MRILFVSNDLIAGHLAYLLTQEGHEVRLYIEEEDRRGNFHNLVEKTRDWKMELSWVGKEGLIIFDDIGFGFVQDALRKEGYNVFGGSGEGDMLEQDRVFGQRIFEESGIQTLPIKNFDDPDQAIQFVKENPRAWVIKQNGLSYKHLNYVGFFSDGRDVIDVLEAYKKNNSHDAETLTLQQRVDGVEIAVTRYFNGNDWIGPMLINIEHKKFFPGDIGPTTSEMGTLGWYEEDEENKLYQETLAKLKPYLQKANYRGIIDINCIVNERGAFPLEATSRPGSPIIHLQTELNLSPWADLIMAIAKGDSCDLKYNDKYGIVAVVAVPPFPYTKKIEHHSHLGTHVYFLDTMTKEDQAHIHFEEVSWHKENNHHYISDTRGYILYVTGTGDTVEEAQRQAYGIIDKIYIPKMMYRNDIGQRFLTDSRLKLKEWGYISGNRTTASKSPQSMLPNLKELYQRSFGLDRSA